MIEPGTILGDKYRLDQELGEGGMGEVWIGEQLAIGRKVAIKLILANRTGEDEFVARFEREARALGRLNHPNCVTLHDFGYDSTRRMHYLVLELVEGVPLSYLMESVWPAETAGYVIRQIALALEHSHAAGVLHRDLKPGNIMLADAGKEGVLVKVLDFGIARMLQGDDVAPLTKSGQVFGTPNYMAPEQAMGDPNIGPAADLYSLGVLYYELITGTNPFEGQTPYETLSNHVGKTEPPLEEVVPSLAKVIHRLLSKAPGDRFDDARGLLDALDRSRVVLMPPQIGEDPSGSVGFATTSATPALGQGTVAPSEDTTDRNDRDIRPSDANVAIAPTIPDMVESAETAIYRAPNPTPIGIADPRPRLPQKPLMVPTAPTGPPASRITLVAALLVLGMIVAGGYLITQRSTEDASAEQNAAPIEPEPQTPTADNEDEWHERPVEAEADAGSGEDSGAASGSPVAEKPEKAKNVAQKKKPRTTRRRASRTSRRAERSKPPAPKIEPKRHSLDEEPKKPPKPKQPKRQNLEEE